MLTLMLLALCLGRLTTNGRDERKGGRLAPLPFSARWCAKKFAIIKSKT